MMCDFPQESFPISEPTVVDAILHIVYAKPCHAGTYTFPEFVSAIDQMHLYEISPKDHLIPPNPSFSYILSFAPLFPLDLYALAASHDLFELAIATLPHLLSFPLAMIDDITAMRIGGVYLKRLMSLHLSRHTSLKEILFPAPHPHAPTRKCSFDNQKRLQRAWTLAAAYLSWNMQPDLSITSIQTTLSSLEEQVDCEECREELKTRIKDVIERWASVPTVKLSIHHHMESGVNKYVRGLVESDI
ncbi:hypothetical protein DXG03_003934 [Asterophora parasitica]|uniref:Uncharacterized protein n=1 Tax=Asterophora parasitica TaxID=117018 RepID=A0A9P7G354_9AGAR|nr:hypothetical protein DXG03_003934 [Asterophora parasitica]